MVLKPFYNKKKISKSSYKDIMRKCVPKVRFLPLIFFLRCFSCDEASRSISGANLQINRRVKATSFFRQIGNHQNRSSVFLIKFWGKFYYFLWQEAFENLPIPAPPSHTVSKIPDQRYTP